jgi:hypothetical protein
MSAPAKASFMLKTFAAKILVILTDTLFALAPCKT